MRKCRQPYMSIFLVLFLLPGFATLVAFADERGHSYSSGPGTTGGTSATSTSSADTFVSSPSTSANPGSTGNTNANTNVHANVSDSGTPPLRDYINGASSLLPDNSGVASFFQVPPAQPLPTSKSETAERGKLKSRTWHILDNLGVPMFGYQGDSLDPSISRSARLPSSTADSTLHSRASQPAAIMQESGYSTIKGNKIPESELDGVELPSLRDAHGKD